LTIGAFAIVLAIALVVRIGNANDRKKRAAAHVELSELSEHLRRYYRDFGYYPTTSQALDFLLGSEELDAGIFRGPAPRFHLPLDPWGHRFAYQSDGNSYLLKSLGPSGAESDPDLTISGGPD